MIDIATLLSTLDATLRVSTPLILCAMAGLFSERSGIIDISLEGKMLSAAFAAGALAAVTGSAWAALSGAIVVSILLSLLHGFACITNRGDQVVSGLAINVLASGLTIVLGIAWFSQGGQTPALSSESRFMPIEFSWADAVSGIPYIGEFLKTVINGHNLPVYVALLAVPVTWWIVYKTRFGLRLRAVGENPLAVDTAGISVSWLRYKACLLYTSPSPRDS